MINKKIFALLLFVTAVSMCAGSFFEVLMVGTGKEQLMEFLSASFTLDNPFGFFPLLINSLKSNYKIYLFLLISPVLPLLVITYPFICISKGLSVGFSSTMLIETFGIGGILHIITTIMPHNVMQMLIFCVLSTASIQMAMDFFKFYFQKNQRKRNKSALQISIRHFLVIFAVSFVILFISCLIEAFLKQFLL